MITARGSTQTTAAALSDIGPLSPSPWDTMLQRRRSSLGLSALLGTVNASDISSWNLTANDQQSMFGAIAELAGIADDLKSAAAASTFTSTSTTSSASTSPSSTSSPGKLDGGADGAVPDLDMASSSDETEATATNLGFANQIRRASVTLNALLSGASDPMLKPALSMFQSSLASQAASAALAAAAAASSSSSSSSSYASSAHPAAPQLTIEIEPWALESAVMSLADNRKRSREAEEQEQEQEYADEDEGTYSCSASEASSSPLPFHLAPQPKTKKAKGGGSSSSKAGQKRPRRVMPNSQAVKEAMPKPPPRGTKNPVKEEMYANMEPEAARLEKNRQSAKECRLRKKEYVFNLEKKVAEFEDREVARAAELAAVRSELAQLQREYSDALAGRK